jgi:hypothetical protein
VARIQIVSALSLEGRSVTLTAIDASCPQKHSYRFEVNTFKKGTIVTKGPPRRLSELEIEAMLNNLKENESGDGYIGFGTEHNWTHKCGLWELSYVKALILMHNIDVMHQERNVGESILSTCMNLGESRLEGVNRTSLKFTNLITTTSRVSVRNIDESEREGAKQIASE